MRTVSSLVSVRVVIAILTLSVGPPLALGAWPELGRAVCTAAGSQEAPRITADGAGGAILAWQDFRSPIVNIFAQHVRGTGDVDAGWPVNGRALLANPLALPSGPGGRAFPVIVLDGAGGAIVAWQDDRSSVTQTDIFAQHVLASGAVDVAWPVNGAALSVVAGAQDIPAIASDGAGGAIVTWMDGRPGASVVDVYAQHVLASGRVDARWPANGVAVSTAAGPQEFPAIVSDGTGGAIITWYDLRNAANGFDIYAQHVLSSGVVDPAWPVNGRALSLAARDQLSPTIVSDGVHGAIVTWYDARDGLNHIFAQRVLGSGAIAPGWPVNGRAVCIAPLEQIDPVITSDGAGGAIVSWRDFRSGVSHNPFAQHVLASGAIDPAWPVNGRALSLSSGDEARSSIVVDGAGGAIIAWEEDSFIFAQHIRASGLLDPAFPVNGRFLRLLLTFQHNPDLVSDGAGNAIATWSDREFSESDIYAMQVLASAQDQCSGAPGAVPAEVDNGVRVSKSGSAAVITWNVAAGATGSDILRGRVSGLPVGFPGASEQCLADNTPAGTLTDGGLPLAGDAFWYLVRGENACGEGPYGFQAQPAIPEVSGTCP
jgi:hypothetical protein